MTSRPVKFPDELWEQVLKVAEREDRSAAWVVRRAVEDYIGGRDVVAGLPRVDAEALARSQVSYEMVDVKTSPAKIVAPKSMIEEGQRERDKIAEAAKSEARAALSAVDHECHGKLIEGTSIYRCKVCDRRGTTKW